MTSIAPSRPIVLNHTIMIGPKYPPTWPRSDGFAPLGAADGAVKSAIFGYNSARLYKLDLRAELPGIATNLLAERLKELESAGVVDRAELPAPIARTVYRLSDAGWQREDRKLEEVAVVETGDSVFVPGISHPLPVLISPSVDARFGPTAVLGIPCFSVDRKSVDALLSLVEAEPETVVTAHVDTGVVDAGGLTIQASLPQALRDAFVSGQWNPTAMLLDRFEDVQAVANRLPYIRGF